MSGPFLNTVGPFLKMQLQPYKDRRIFIIKTKWFFICITNSTKTKKSNKKETNKEKQKSKQKEEISKETFINKLLLYCFI